MMLEFDYHTFKGGPIVLHSFDTPEDANYRTILCQENAFILTGQENAFILVRKKARPSERDLLVQENAFILDGARERLYLEIPFSI
jgi:hypothetical protein